MTSLLITVSGYSGGSAGPQNIYSLFHNFCDKSLTVLSIDTVPNDIEANVKKVKEVVSQLLQQYDAIYFMGYSMGGAVVAEAAYQVKDLTNGKLKGAVLLSSQTDGIAKLNELSIPVLFYHGKKDQIFYDWEIESLFSRIQGKKKLIFAEDLTHELRFKDSAPFKDHSHILAKDIVKEFEVFFSTPSQDQHIAESNIIIKKLPLKTETRNTCSIF